MQWRHPFPAMFKVNHAHTYTHTYTHTHTHMYTLTNTYTRAHSHIHTLIPFLRHISMSLDLPFTSPLPLTTPSLSHTPPPQYVVVDKPAGVPVIPPVDNRHETAMHM